SRSTDARLHTAHAPPRTFNPPPPSTTPMAAPASTPGTSPVSDHRPAPRGVIPRRLQMWLMVGVAAGMLMIIILTGHSQPSPRVTSTSATPPLPGLSPDRLREFQDRLRALDDRARADSTGEPSRNPRTNVRE